MAWRPQIMWRSEIEKLHPEPNPIPVVENDRMNRDIAVIVVNWKVRDLLRECLCSVYKDSGLTRGAYEVIVVDNDSGDGSVEMMKAEFPQARLIANGDNVGFGAANNQAFALTSASTIILLNPDTVVKDAALAKMAAVLEDDPAVGIVGCELRNRDGSLQRWTAGAFPTLANAAFHYLFLNRLAPQGLRPATLYLEQSSAHFLEVDWVSGACMAIRRAALDDRLFDRRFFMYAEDMELCYRLKGNGWKILYDPRASIIHYQGASMQQQSAEIMLSSLKCPRHFFEILHGPRAARVFDKIVVAGFFLRWAINSLAAKVFGRSALSVRARASHRYLQLALRVMRESRGSG